MKKWNWSKLGEILSSWVKNRPKFSMRRTSSKLHSENRLYVPRLPPNTQRNLYSGEFNFCFFKTHFLMFWLWHFSLSNTNSVFVSILTFFDLNDETFVNFLQWWLPRNLEKVTRAVPEHLHDWKNWKIYMPFITKDEMTIFIQNRVLKKSQSLTL